jgi:hypothetical protein
MDLPTLNLPLVDFKTKLVNQTVQVFDEVRMKYVNLTPEEWVRQNFIHYLKNIKCYPFSLMGIEKTIAYNSLKKRADIVLYNREAQPIMIVECKSANVNINQDVFYQISRYNSVLKVKYLVVINGIRHMCCSIDYKSNKLNFLKEIPSFRQF